MQKNLNGSFKIFRGHRLNIVVQFMKIVITFANSADPVEMPPGSQLFIKVPNWLVLANRADSDEIPQNLAFHLGLHCFESINLQVSSPKGLKIQITFFLYTVFLSKLL